MNTARSLHRSAKTGAALASGDLDTLLQRADIWRGNRSPQHTGHVATGHVALDECLPGGGWPVGALTELFPMQPGIGELSLLMPALATLSQKEHWIACIGAPYLPYPPALAAAGLCLAHLLVVEASARECLWATEQALRSGACAAVLAWPEAADDRALRRLQLAAEEGDTLGFLFRPTHAARHASPAALRLALAPGDDALVVQVLKCRGGWSRSAIHLARTKDFNHGGHGEHGDIHGQNAVSGVEHGSTRGAELAVLRAHASAHAPHSSPAQEAEK
ncbi:MAG: translesion DNA synthesis-associated protein ImuA [Thiohalomonadaceae bacterium]